MKYNVHYEIAKTEIREGMFEMYVIGRHNPIDRITTMDPEGEIKRFAHRIKKYIEEMDEKYKGSAHFFATMRSQGFVLKEVVPYPVYSIPIKGIVQAEI